MNKDTSNLVINHSCESLTFTTIGSSVFNFIGVIELMGIPSNVAKTIISSLAIVMTSFLSFFRKPDECKKDKTMDSKEVCWFSVFPQTNVQVPSPVVVWLQYFTWASSPRLCLSANSTLIRNTVNGFVPRNSNREPLFDVFHKIALKSVVSIIRTITTDFYVIIGATNPGTH